VTEQPTRARLLLSAAAAALLLTACGSGHDAEGHERPRTVQPHYVDLPDGRRVLCVWEKQGYGGGVSCDWGKAA
jgi:hypothetical protein